MTPDILNSTGLFLDIIGITLLFFFGLPSEVRKGGTGFLIIGQDEHEAGKWKQYKCISWTALATLIIGFTLQIISNHI